MLDLQGRRLPPEKILFKNSSIVANMEADWSRECLKEHVISAVRLLYKAAHSSVLSVVLFLIAVNVLP